jgi:trigger factor
VSRETESVTKEYAKVARIPGFRPGRAPHSLVQRRFRDEIQSDVVQSLVPKFFENAVRQNNLSVVGRPRFDDLKFEADQPLRVKATFEVYPEFQLREYKGLEVEEEPATVTEDDVAKALENLREHWATFEVVSGRAAEMDDYVMVSYEGRDASDPSSTPVAWREGSVHLGGKGTIREFTDNLIGAKPGETREFDVTYPADFPQKKLAGKTLHYRVEIQSIKKRVLPAVDDELARTASEFSTLEELKQDIRQKLETQRRRDVEQSAKLKLIEKLVEAHEFPVPEALVEARLERKLERLVGQLLAQGIDPRTASIDWGRMREEARPDAEREARGMMILSKIAEAEKIELSEEELDDAIREMAEEGRETPAALKTRLTETGEIDKLKSSRRNQKALDFIYQNAKIVRRASQPDHGPEAAERPEPMGVEEQR